LYPKGFLYPVKGNVKGSDNTFDALDADSEDIYEAKTAGPLRIGLDTPIEKPIQTGVFKFKNKDLDSILTDLTYIQSKNADSKVVSLTLAILLKKRGEILALGGRNNEALIELDRAIKAFQATDERLYSTSLSRLYRLKAGLYKSAGDQDRFNENVNKSLEAVMVASEFYSQLKESRFSFLRSLTTRERFLLLTKTDFFTSRYRDTLCGAFIFLSIYYIDTGDLNQSLFYAERSLEEARKTGNKELISRSYYWLGWRHYVFGFYDRAEKMYLKALDYCPTEGYMYTLQYYLALNYLKMGRIKTVEEFRAFIKLPAPFPPMLNPSTNYPAYFYREIGSAQTYLKIGEYDKGIKLLEDIYYQKRFRGAFATRSSSIEMDILLDLGDAYLNIRRYDDCLKVVNLLESKIQEEPELYLFRFRISLLKGQLSARKGENPLNAYLESISNLEQIRPKTRGLNDYEFWEKRLFLYELTIDLFSRQNDVEHALEMAEKARSRLFLDYLGNKRLGVKSTAGALQGQQAEAILDSLSAIEKDMVESARASGIKVRNVYQEGTRYTKQLENYRTTVKAIAKADKQFGVTQNILSVSVQAVQKSLAADTTILEYYLTDDTLYTWVMDRNDLKLVRQNISADELKDLIVAFRNNLFSDRVKRDLAITKKPIKEVVNFPEKLYGLLISPVRQYIKTNRICIVPYGVLNYLPFQALHDGRKYLIEQYTISYIPSLSVLEFLVKGEKKPSYKILAFGNPDLKDTTLDLPATEKEVEEIKGIFPSAEIFKREKATKVLAKKLAPQFDIIHFASHGEYVPENPLASCIRLAPEDGDDGRLEANEIFDMDIKADLIVTSACQTSIGQIRKGDEVVGLTRAFLYAGASSVLGSLWSISDEATAVLMKEFCENLRKLDKAEALRQAQVKMIRSKEYSNPYYWAAFNLTGSF